MLLVNPLPRCMIRQRIDSGIAEQVSWMVTRRALLQSWSVYV